jgi:hypothetical protein
MRCAEGGEEAHSFGFEWSSAFAADCLDCASHARDFAGTLDNSRWKARPSRTSNYCPPGAQFIGLTRPVGRFTGFSTTSVIASKCGMSDSSRPRVLLRIAQVQPCFEEGSCSENTSAPLPPDSIIRNSLNPHSKATLLAAANSPFGPYAPGFFRYRALCTHHITQVGKNQHLP